MPSVFDGVLSPSMLNLHGLPGSGKSGAALQLSADWPKPEELARRIALAEAGKPITSEILLRDVIYIAHDKGGMDGFIELGIKPKYAVDVARMLSKLRPGENRIAAKDIIEAQNKIGHETRAICERDGKVKLIIRDTITRLDKRLQEFWQHREEFKNDKRAMWGVMLANHMKDLELYQSISGVLIVNLFHSKAINDDATNAKQGERAKTIIVRLGNLSVSFAPDLSGQSLNAYTGDAIELCATSRFDKQKKQWLYLLHAGDGPKGGDTPNGERVKNRLRASLPGGSINASALRGILLKAKILPS